MTFYPLAKFLRLVHHNPGGKFLEEDVTDKSDFNNSNIIRTL